MHTTITAARQSIETQADNDALGMVLASGIVATLAHAKRLVTTASGKRANVYAQRFATMADAMMVKV